MSDDDLKSFLLSLPGPLLKRLDRLIQRKKRLEVRTRKECNRQTETRLALEAFLDSENKRLDGVKPPARIS